MSILLILGPILFGLYWIIRMQVHSSQIRYLVDTYGLSRQKLRPLKYKAIKQLRRDTQKLSGDSKPFELEALLKPYRA
jgi:hypothetical protein